MRKALVLLVSTVMLVGLSVPAIATHNSGHMTPVTITVANARAGVCSTAPQIQIPQGLIDALADNRSGPAGFVIPLDLGLGTQSGKCEYTTDGIWDQSGQVGRFGTANCNNVTINPEDTDTTADDCHGVHLPGFGPPVQPGRFLNASNSTDNSTNVYNSSCEFVSAGPGGGTESGCYLLSIGYFEKGNAGGSSHPFGGAYCGSSSGFGWTVTSTDSAGTENLAFGILRWSLNSAGTILPIEGSVTGENWGFREGHYESLDVAGRNWTGARSFFSLTTARSYVAGVDNTPQTTGGCGPPSSSSGNGFPHSGARQFVNNSVVIAFGD